MFSVQFSMKFYLGKFWSSFDQHLLTKWPLHDTILRGKGEKYPLAVATDEIAVFRNFINFGDIRMV